MRKATKNWRRSIGEIRIYNLQHADDTVLLASTESEMASLLEKIEI